MADHNVLEKLFFDRLVYESKKTRTLFGTTTNICAKNINKPASFRPFFYDKTANVCPLLIRLKGLSREGVNMNLRESARFIQYILWEPFIGDSSKCGIDIKCSARKHGYSTPAEYLVSLITDEQITKILGIVGKRWDSQMMLGGQKASEKIVKKFFKTQKEEIKKKIYNWFGFLHWNEKWDWTKCAMYSLFGQSDDISLDWVDTSYELSANLKEDIIFSSENTDVMKNITSLIEKQLVHKTGQSNKGNRLAASIFQKEKSKQNVGNKRRVSFTNDYDRRYHRLFGEVPPPKKSKFS